MRDAPSEFVTALNNARETGIVPRRLIWFRGRNRTTGFFASLGMWTGDEDVDFTLTDGFTNSSVTRTYYGAGLGVEVSSIPRVSDLTIQTVTITISQIAAISQLLVRDYDLRLGKVQIHEALFAPGTASLVAPPQVVFLGEIDAAPIQTPPAGQDGSIEIRCVSDAISMLTRKNPKLSSVEGQRLRGGDQWGKYAGAIKHWRIPWGLKK